MANKKEDRKKKYAKKNGKYYITEDIEGEVKKEAFSDRIETLNKAIDKTQSEIDKLTARKAVYETEKAECANDLKELNKLTK